MKIAHVTSGLCRRSAGLAAAVAGISAATQHSGSDVRVFGIATEDWIQDSTAWEGAPAAVFHCAKHSGSFAYAPELLSALLDYNPDVVHLHGLWTYPALAVLRWHRNTRRPFLVSAHGMLMPVSLRHKSIRKRVAYLIFQRNVLRAAAVLHATSAAEEAAYRRLGFSRTALIPLGVNPDKNVACKSNTAGRRALFLGRLHPQKGVDLLIDAWQAVEAEFPAWELSVVGPDDPGSAGDVQRYRQSARHSRVTFTGPLYGPAKRALISNSELLIMPSRSENFGIVAAEALTLGVPVIATTGTPWSGLVSTRSGWWVDPESKAIEGALRQALQMTPQELSRMGENGRNWVEREYSQEAVRSKWQRAYTRITLGTTLDK